jgi:pimeloyl-ACP methyl ester carboxylesterase
VRRRALGPQADALADVAEVQVADLTQDDRVEAMAARVLAQAPARFALAGLSMGGYVAFEILRQAPERVSRLALLDTTAAPDSPERALQRRRSLAILKRGRFLGVTQQLLPTLVHPAMCTARWGRRCRPWPSVSAPKPTGASRRPSCTGPIPARCCPRSPSPPWCWAARTTP